MGRSGERHPRVLFDRLMRLFVFSKVERSLPLPVQVAKLLVIQVIKCLAVSASYLIWFPWLRAAQGNR